MTGKLTIALGQFSTAGAKDENQDFHGALQPEGADLASKGIAVCLADGISTSAVGAMAAETAVKTFLSDYLCTSPTWSVATSGSRVIAAVNSWMYAQNRRSMPLDASDAARERGMVCTFSAMVLKGRSAYLFHIGDARIARLSGETLEPLTEAHRIDLGGGETYLGRALGVNERVEIDHAKVAVSVGDCFVLTTDGIHDELPDRAVAAILRDAPDLDSAARSIAEAALEAGSTDNLTVQIVRVGNLPDGVIDDLLGSDASLPPAPALAAGQDFDGYAIVDVIHSGSRSHVYRARDKATGGDVALKVLSTEMAQSPDAQSALMLEEWVMRRLDHPGLLKAPPPSPSRAHAFSVAEFVEGQSLHAWRLDHPRPDLDTVRDLVKQIGAGLQAMHRREMVHRDLRPHNVLIDGAMRARIIDFGSVRVAGLDEIAPREEDAAYAGTMQYSAPELYLGYPATAQSDLFSLGVIAYQLLTGELPYGPRVAAARTRGEQRKLTYVPVTEINPDVPDWMDAAIAHAVAIEPHRRYAELSEFLVDFARPNRALTVPRPVPLLDRGGVRTWQLISLALAIALAVSVLTRPDENPTISSPTQETAP
jgi:serine/threonine protein kinase/serine/threonine protein phosphatase PrpC